MNDLARGNDGLRHDQRMRMIGHTADLKCSHRMSPRNAADVLPYALFDLWLYPLFAMLGAENDVVEER